MAFDFPTGPLMGQVYVSAQGVEFTWNGYAWVRNSTGGSAAGDYVLKSGDFMTGFLNLHANPIQPMHAVNKQYVDILVASQLSARAAPPPRRKR